MRQHLTVRLGAELGALRLELVSEALEVLDDPVVHHHEGPRRIPMGVCIGVGRGSVGRPAGVTDADRSLRRLCSQEVFEVGDLALGLADVDRAVGHGNAGGVVPAVLESLEAVDEDRACILRPDISHDPAHRARSPFVGDGAIRRWAVTVDLPLTSDRSLSPGSLRGFAPIRHDRERPRGHPPNVSILPLPRRLAPGEGRRFN